MSAIQPELLGAITYQTYETQPSIGGVWLQRLNKHRSDNGAFMEYLRLTGGQTDGLAGEFRVRQLSVSWAEAGRINAFHIHPKREQNEIWCVIAGQLLVWLVDLRADSATSGQKTAFVLSGEEPALLHLPAGVAHGYKAGANGATLLYSTDDQFNRDDPNEGRLPWDFFGAELWHEDKG